MRFSGKDFHWGWTARCRHEPYVSITCETVRLTVNALLVYTATRHRYRGRGQRMADIFLSYSRKDSDHAKRFAERLSEYGWTVWWDTRILPGTQWDREIVRELKSARVVVVLWSRHSVESDFVQAEARRGLKRGILIPASIDDVNDDDLPLAFDSRQTAHLAAPDPIELEQEWNKLLAAIESDDAFSVRGRFGRGSAAHARSYQERTQSSCRHQ